MEIGRICNCGSLALTGISEQNASGGVIVTAPTCGSCGILPEVLYYAKIEHSISDEKIINVFAIAELIGNLVKKNKSCIFN